MKKLKIWRVFFYDDKKISQFETAILHIVMMSKIGKKMSRLKVSQFQNEFMKSSFLPKYERKITRISALCSEAHYRAEILTIFCSYFGRNNDFINSFCNLLTFKHKHISRSLKRLVILTSRVLTGPYLTCSSKLYDNEFQFSSTFGIPTFILDFSIHFYFIFLSHQFFGFLQIR